MQNISIAIHKMKGVPELSLDVRKSGVLALCIHDSAEPEVSCGDDVTLLLDIRHHAAVSRAVADFNLALLRVHETPSDARADALSELAKIDAGCL